MLDGIPSGYRLIDGDQLNLLLQNPQWSAQTGITATPGGTLATSKELTQTVSRITSAVAGAGVRLPQALGRTMLIINDTGNEIRVFSDSTINGTDGATGVLQFAGEACLYVSADTEEWVQLPFAQAQGPVAATTQWSTDTLATFALTPFVPAVQVVNVLGYSEVGIGGLQVYRLDGPDPLNPYVWRSADRWKADGTEDPVNGGYWALLTDGVLVQAESVGFVANDAGAAAANDAAFVDWQTYLALIESGSDFDRATIALAWPGKAFYFSDTFQFKYRTIFLGNASGFQGASGAAKFYMPANKGSLVFNRHNTLGPVYNPAFTWTGADGSVVDGIHFEPQDGSFALVPYAYAIWMKARGRVSNCHFAGYGNNPIAIIATSGSADEQEGNANGWEVYNCSFNQNPVHCIFTFGADVNAGASVSGLDAVSSCGLIKDSSFLGNSYAYAQFAGMFAGDSMETWNLAPLVHYNGELYHVKNGNGDANIAAAQITRPSGTTADNAAWIWKDTDGPSEFIPTWGEFKAANGLVYNVQVGQEANMWTNEPSVSPAVWGVGVAPTPGEFYLYWPTAAAMVNKTGLWAGSPFDIGPYVHAGPYQATNDNNACLFTNCYTEDSFWSDDLSYMRGGALVIGGRMSFSSESYTPVIGFNGAFQYFSFLSSIIVEYAAGAVGIAGEEGAVYLFGGDDVYFPDGYSFRRHPGDPQNLVECNSADSNDWWRFLTGPNTDYQFNTGNPVTYAVQHRILFLYGTNGDEAVRVYAGPTDAAMEYGPGDIGFEDSPDGSGRLAQQCVTGGTPGTHIDLYGAQVPIWGAKTVADLAGLAGVIAGAQAYVTDLLAPVVPGQAVTGGGTLKGLVEYNGTSWVGVTAYPVSAKYNSNATAPTANNLNLVAADITGGAVSVSLDLTGLLTGASTLTLPTVADMVAAIPGAYPGMSFELVIGQTQAAAAAYTLTTNTGWTLSGQLTINQNVWRKFVVTLTSLTAATIVGTRQIGTMN
jgi:hypothetical protein